MNTRKFFLSLLLLVTATFMSGVFAQSAEEAAKYGQLQEIQVPAAGKLGKFVKKADPNATALKISGELNEKDLAILFSLPNIAYLDLSDAKNIATTYEYKGKDGKVELKIDPDEFMLLCGNSLKYLVMPKGKSIVSILPEVNYVLDWLELSGDQKFINCGKEKMERYSSSRLPHNKWDEAANISVKNVKVRSIKEGSSNMSLSQYIYDYFSKSQARMADLRGMNLSALAENGISCEALYIAGDGNSVPREVRSAFFRVKAQDIIIESTGEKFLKYYYGDAKVVDLSSYDAIIAGAFAGTSVEEVNLGNKITIIPEYCFRNCENLKKIIMPNVTTVKQGAFESTNIISSLHLTYKLPAESAELNLTELKGTGITKVDLTEHPYAPELKRPTEIANSNSGSRQEDRYAWEDMKKNIEFVIPGGARNHRYNVGDWKELKVTEFGVQDAYTFKLDTIGSLKNFINDDNALNIRKLTLKGVMDETEFEYIRKCKYLTYLDMSQCFTFASVSVAKNKAKAELAFAQLLALASGWDRQQKELQYANHETTAEQLQQAQLRDYFIQNSGIQDISIEDVDAIFGQGKVFPSSECYFPEYALVGLWELEEIKFPRKLLKLEVKNLWDRSKFYTKLKKVTFSNELKFLGDHLFEGASALQEVNFPDSLQYIGVSCFRDAGLTKVDLSNTQIKFWSESARKDATNMLFTDAFVNCPLTEFHSPIKAQYPKNWYDDQWIKNDKPNEVVMYMNMPEPFCNAEVLQGLLGRIKEIHIPRGMKAAWRGYPNLIDDIDL